MTRKFGLIGYPLSHSFSKKYFSSKFENENISDCEYLNFEIDDIAKFPGVVQQNDDLVGLNVTIPYKQQVMPYLDKLDETATGVGAVNTVKVTREDGNVKLEGYNSDVYGFEISLKKMLSNGQDKALILGTGGASKAIKFVLEKLGVDYISASIEELKEKEIRYEDIDKELILEREIIINATPLGTYPKVDTCPDIPYQFITPNHVLFDLVYNPETTRFMQYGMEKGAKTKNGLEMLHLQAERSWAIWNGLDL